MCFFTLEGNRLNRGEMKEITGERLSLCSPDELRMETGCTPGCVAPFWLFTRSNNYCGQFRLYVR